MDSQPVLRLYNTSARAEEVFVPLDASRVRMYVCGPTVYDRAHIGNARPIIVFDVLFRLLRKLYGEAHVTYVRNITDVDDKINARAAERGISIRELTEETTKIFHADVAALGCLPPSHEPRATDHIGDMIRLIERLIARGHAYAAEGHVLFQVASMPSYGQLARRSLDEMEAGARVEVAPYKRDPMDFVLWKPSSEDLPGWDSPWGRGRPGWHIECSAMSMAKLLEPFGGGLSCDDPLKNAFDIHGGGIDLVFPHHENEVAQSCCALDVPRMANVWMHNGFLQVEGQKMSKSLGNFRTIGEVLAEWPGDVARLAMLMTNYRQPIDWTQSKLSEAKAKLGRWRQAVAGAQGNAEAAGVFAALAQDLNTWGAVAEMDRLAKTALAGGADASRAAAELLGAMTFFGFDQAKAAAAGVDAAEVEALIAARLAARAAKNWAESDRIRDELKSRGIVLKDNKDGTTAWSVEG